MGSLKGSHIELGGGAGVVATALTIIFVVNSIHVYVYGIVQGERYSLPISLDVNFFNVGVFYGPSLHSFLSTVLPEAGSAVVVVASLMSMQPPRTIRIGVKTILTVGRQKLRRMIKAFYLSPSFFSSEILPPSPNLPFFHPTTLEEEGG